MKTANIETVTCKWETSGNGDCRRLVREYWVGRRVVRFEVVVTEYIPVSR